MGFQRSVLKGNYYNVKVLYLGMFGVHVLVSFPTLQCPWFTIIFDTLEEEHSVLTGLLIVL